jgi:hypothetical protein
MPESHEYADVRIARWLNRNQYHPRSDKHGRALCEFFLEDLLNESHLLRDAAAKGRLVYDEDFPLGEGALRWTIDLVLGPSSQEKARFLSGRIAKSEPEQIWLAVDAKSVMTEHGKARRNRQRDLNSLADIVKHYYPNSVVGGLILLNMSTRFKSPLRNEFLTHHNIERLVEETIEIFNQIPRADIKGGRGIEGVGVIVVDHTNDPKDKTSLITHPPAPQGRDQANYHKFLWAIRGALERRFFA